MKIQARAPGKIIITGEHAVVYDAPALVCAIERYTTVSYQPQTGQHLDTLLTGISRARYPLSQLKALKHKLDKRFEAFIRGELAVQQILHRPDDLVVYTLASLAKHVAHKLPLPHLHQGQLRPGQLHTESALPLGAGMGSSAAAIAATLVLTEELLQQPLSLAQRFEHVRFCERLQHGKGSALDAAATVYGGVQYLEQGKPQPFSWPTQQHWYWLLDGIPSASTGECVAYVRQRHGHDAGLWREFREVITQFIDALQQGQCPKSALHANQTLLTRIGVVPPATEDFINHIQRHGGSAKISGAGSIRGQHGGMILIYHEDSEALQALIPPKALWGKLHIAPQGAHLHPTPLLDTPTHTE